MAPLHDSADERMPNTRTRSLTHARKAPTNETTNERVGEKGEKTNGYCNKQTNQQHQVELLFKCCRHRCHRVAVASAPINKSRPTDVKGENERAYVWCLRETTTGPCSELYAPRQHTDMHMWADTITAAAAATGGCLRAHCFHSIVAAAAAAKQTPDSPISLYDDEKKEGKN